MMIELKNQFPRVLLLTIALVACGRNDKLVTSLKDTPKSVTKTVSGVRVNSNGVLVDDNGKPVPSDGPANYEAFLYECAHVKNYGTTEVAGLVTKNGCVVRASTKDFNSAATSADPQLISSSAAAGSLVVFESDMNGKAAIVTLKNQPFLSAGERKLVPDGGGELSYFVLARPSDVTKGTVVIWDCYDTKMKHVVCDLNAI